MANYERYVAPIVSLGTDTDRTWESDFLKTHPEHLTEGNAMGFISDNGGEEYNLCHCETPVPIRARNRSR